MNEISIKQKTQFPDCYILNVYPKTKKDPVTLEDYTVNSLTIGQIGSKYNAETKRGDATDYNAMLGQKGSVIVEGEWKHIKQQFGKNMYDGTAFLVENVIGFKLDK